MHGLKASVLTDARSPISSLTHSLDCLTSDVPLHPPDIEITSYVTSSICSEPDIDLQLADPSLSGLTSSWTSPLLSVIRSVTGMGVDNQMKCFMCWYWFLQTMYMTKYWDSPVSDSVADVLLLSLVHYWHVAINAGCLLNTGVSRSVF